MRMSSAGHRVLVNLSHSESRSGFAQCLGPSASYGDGEGRASMRSVTPLLKFHKKIVILNFITARTLIYSMRIHMSREIGKAERR